MRKNIKKKKTKIKKNNHDIIIYQFSTISQ